VLIQGGRRDQRLAVGLLFLDPFVLNEQLIGNVELEHDIAVSALVLVERLAGNFPRCRKCKRIVLRGSERDPCIRALNDPTIVSACCGHARPDLATVAFGDGREPLHGHAALRYFAEAGCGPYGDVNERARLTT
jgi:hypothetical protein